MDDRHYSEDELLDRLYGVSARNDGHLDMCPKCGGRWRRLTQARSVVLAQAAFEVPERLLAAQRAEILARTEMRPVSRWLPGPMPAMAMALLCAIVIVISRPAPQPVEISDTQFFAEMYSVAESSEPAAAAPIENLFQGEQSK